MSTLTEWHATKPEYRTMFINGFVVTECKRHKGGWLCKLDGFFKFPAYGKAKKSKKKDTEIKKSAVDGSND